ncbi:MAG: 50S ribosomal protein L20 [Lachnospiraceae bacterium]
MLTSDANRRRDFRSLWITRISAQAKVNGINYSQFMHGLKKSGTTSTERCLRSLQPDKEASQSLLRRRRALFNQ